jgi:hypothetical protein
MQWQIPIEVHKGTRPSIPDKTPPRMMEIWNIAQECWSGHPQDRPSFKSVLNKFNNFATMEDVIPFALREPRQMQVKGE